MIDWDALGDETVELLPALPDARHHEPARQRDGGHAVPGRGARRARASRARRWSRRPAAATWWRASGATARGRHRAAPPHRRGLRRPALLDGGSLRRRDPRRLPLRARGDRHEVHRHPAPRRGARDQAGEGAAQARPHPTRHRRRGSGEPLRRPVRRRPAPRLAGRRGVRAVRAGRYRAGSGLHARRSAASSCPRRPACRSASPRGASRATARCPGRRPRPTG